MTLHSPLFNQNDDYNASEMRDLVGLVPGVGPLQPGQLAVTQRGAGANMSVDIAAGSVVIPTTNGKYLCRSTAVENRAIAASPGGSDVRRDIVVASVRDTQYGDIADEWVIEVITGTPGGEGGGGSVPPDVPVGSVLLATVAIGSSVASITNANITFGGPYAAAIINLPTLVPLPTSAHDGQFVTGFGSTYFRSVSQWIRVATGAMFKDAQIPVPDHLPATSTLAVATPVCTAAVSAGECNVTAIFAGDVYNAGGSGPTTGSCRVDISLDGGSTWTNGREVSAVVENLSGAAETYGEQGITAAHARSGTTTGSIHARLMTRKVGSGSWRIGGGLLLSVKPG